MSDVLDAIAQEVKYAGCGDVVTSPHEFTPLKRWWNRGRCARCLAHEDDHPALGWLPGRGWHDDREAIRV